MYIIALIWQEQVDRSRITYITVLMHGRPQGGGGNKGHLPPPENSKIKGPPQG